MIWTAALLYQITDKVDYQLFVEQKLEDLLDCQENEGISLFDGSLLKGMFYRDEEKKKFFNISIIRQENIFMLMLWQKHKKNSD